MKFLIVTLTALALNGAPSDAEQLRALKQVSWPKAYREQDTALLDRILDADFRLTDGNGVVTKKTDELDWLRKNKPSWDRFDFEIERLDIYGGDTAIISGLGTIAGKRDGKPYVVRYRSTNVLVKRDGTWRAVASHTSDVAP